ncbi:MAG: ASKHA domain-containing protein [Christensenellales bacterium]
MPKLILRQGDTRREIPFTGTPLLMQVLKAEGIAHAHPCGGGGRCGQCRVSISGAVSPPGEAERRHKSRLSCQCVLLGDCEAILPPAPLPLQIQLAGAARPAALRPLPGRYGAAVDIGTTTLALTLYDLGTGAALSSVGAANPQASVAADVMGRIGAALQGGLPGLQGMIQAALLDLLGRACRTAAIPEAQVASLVIAGNTAMLTLLTGGDVAPLSRAPFLAASLFDGYAELIGRQAYLPPCLDAFVGADISCALLASGLCGRGETALLVDVGTNGEIALWRDGRLHVCSTAAGPAFEGAGIHLGCGPVPGAIDSVALSEDGGLRVHTIGDLPATGICGSGLIDALACLLKGGRITATGATDESRLYLTPDVYLIPRDIRNAQLAKAAIAAGITTLLRHTGTDLSQVAALYLAGGFGSRLDYGSAAAIGLLPETLSGRVQILGNASLGGAGLLLLDRENQGEIRRIKALARALPLGGNPLFNAAYLEALIFPGGEEG